MNNPNEWEKEKKYLGGKIHRILNETLFRKLTKDEYAQLVLLIAGVFALLSRHDKERTAEEIKKTADAIEMSKAGWIEQGRQERTAEIIEMVEKRLAYHERFHSDEDDKSFRSGFSQSQSGPCCKRCQMSETETNPLRVAVGCKDPFQVDCSCHIPFRKVAIAARERTLNEILDILTTLRPPERERGVSCEACRGGTHGQRFQEELNTLRSPEGEEGKKV